MSECVTTSLLRYQTYQIEQACRTSAGDPSGSTGALLLPDNSKPRSRIGETLAVSSPAEFRVAAKTWKFTGSRKRRRRKVNGVYARVYVLDQQGEYRTVASIDWFNDRQIALELEDNARDLAERLGVQFQVLS